ncbi:MAG: UPF0182 family protein [Xanthobacteraceae bacterium]|nr:UPF0182 family protein [Xanthobacteraceae bacterium]
MVGIFALVILVTCLIILGLTSDFLVDWLWFGEIGYPGVFWTTIVAQAATFCAALVATALILWANGALADRFARSPWARLPELRKTNSGAATSPHPLQAIRHHSRWPFVIACAACLIAILVGWGEVHNWSVFLRLLYQVPFGTPDPVYGKDIGFYLFSLPAYVAIKNWMLLTLFLSALFAGAIYWVQGHITYDAQRRSMSSTAIAHGSVLLALFFAVKAWSYGLDRYLLLYGDNGVVVGAGYTDVHVRLPILWVLVGLSIIAAVAAAANVRARSYLLPAGAAVLVFGGSFALSALIPGLFQRLVVKPDELQREKPYIEHNIALTRQAYNLRQISAKPFPAEQDLTLKALEANKATIDNIRLWDWQPLMDAYAQLQEIRTYYKFHDVEVDRYWLDSTYQSVTLSARELKSSLLPPNAQTWVNTHILFTHGNGVVMSPVTRKNTEGLPLFYLRDIPPVASGGPDVREPRIYFGEETDTYVIVKASTPEFDYPKGKENSYASYDGSAGIAVGGGLQRLLFGWYFSDVNLLLSNYITDDSRIVIHRRIQDRVSTIAPFLRLDHDPYVVISDGRLFWVQDAYTTSNYFPYAPPAPGLDLNYIRNSVKIVIDAYNGTTNFYLMDTSDPVAATYQRIFPSLFKPFTAMPAGLRQHIRYPEDLFVIQAQLYQAYHMEAADVFYNREDLWEFPRQPGGGGTTRMEPYYIIMRLPGEAQAQFFLMLPMVPTQRDNMIAWLAARCDAPDYGRLIVYEFPKDKLVYGPFQIEALINQNTYISQQISLWNQMGSRIIRGNLLVVPIENSLLYVSPLYLRAEQGQLPELKRVIAAYGDRVVMQETLPEALAALFGTVPAPVSAGGGAEAPLEQPATDRGREALDHYNQAIEHLKSGDWVGFGTELDRLGGVLQDMGRAPAGH